MFHLNNMNYSVTEKQLTKTNYFTVYQSVLHLQSSLTLMHTLTNGLQLYIASHS